MTSSRRNYAESNFRRGNTPPDNLPFVYRHASYFEDIAQPYIENDLIEWCENNCQQHWAWWFDAKHAYIGFASQEELMQFRLSV
jgi:hypothetical protein